MLSNSDEFIFERVPDMIEKLKKYLLLFLNSVSLISFTILFRIKTFNNIKRLHYNVLCIGEYYEAIYMSNNEVFSCYLSQKNISEY